METLLKIANLHQSLKKAQMQRVMLHALALWNGRGLAQVNVPLQAVDHDRYDHLVHLQSFSDEPFLERYVLGPE